MLRLKDRFIAESRTESSRRAARAFVAALAIFGSAAASRAGEPRPPGQTGSLQDLAIPYPQPAAQDEARPKAPAEFTGHDGVLALVDGRVVSGKVTPAPGGYLLKRPGAADEMVPAFLVQTAAESLTGCYENLRDAIGSTRPESHLELADWCLKQKLLDEARTEVVAALKLDPNRRDARELLTRIEDATNPQPRHRQSEDVPSRSGDGYLEPTGRTTEGISAEATSLFVRRVQPLMVSKCGNAACHGGKSGGEFHLVNVRRTSSTGRAANLENLRAVLSRIDSGEAGETKLLGPLENKTHLLVFTGPPAATQEAIIREWVQDVAAEKGLKPRQREVPVRSRERTPAIELAAAATSSPVKDRLPAGSDASPREKKPVLQRVTSPPRLKKTAADDDLAERVLREERPDPFDPEEFNREVQSRFGDIPETPR